MTAVAEVGDALREAEPRPFWTDRPDAPAPCPPPAHQTRCDVLVIGGGFTGLWAAIEARIAHPSVDVMLVDAHEIAFGASGRNGGIVSDSLTNGLERGVGLWPDEMEDLVRLGRSNLHEIADFVASSGIDAGLRVCGNTSVATQPRHLESLVASRDLRERFGEDVTLLDAAAVRADVDSPTYVGGLRSRTGSGLVDPAALCWGLKAAAVALGVRIHEHTPVRAMRLSRDRVEVAVDHGCITATGVILATNAYSPLVKSMRVRILPVHNHVLVTEPLPPQVLRELGWAEGQPLTDVGNRVYCRRTPDDRVLVGCYDSVHSPGGTRRETPEQQALAHEALAGLLFTTFPQLTGVRFTHRWSGIVDASPRCTPFFGTALSGRVAYAAGYTGHGIATSRFGARVAIDLLSGLSTERTRLQMVRRKPVPFPPAPLRSPMVQATIAARARAEVTGRRGAYLRLLDRLGVAYGS